MATKAFLSQPTTPGNLQSAAGRLEQKAMQQKRAIRERAFEIFQSRSGEPGSPVVDWLEAESAARAHAAR